MKPQELYDIYGIWHVPFWKTNWFLWGMTGGIIGIVMLVGWYLVRNMKRKQTPSWERALQKLKPLYDVHIQSVHEGHQVYCQLTDILKEYFGKRYAHAAKAMTDEELMMFLPTVDFPAQLLSDIQTILQAGTHIKFAGVPAIASQFNTDLETSHMIIVKTIPSSKK